MRAQFTKTFTMLLLSLFALMAAGCGGSGSNSSSSGQTVVIGASNVALVVTNTSLQLSGSTTVSAAFKRADGSPASGVAVNFSTTLGTLTPAGVVATDSAGVATVTLTAGSTSGQGQVSASATVDNRLVTSTALFSVNLPVLKLANLALTNNPTSISYGSSQGVSVEVQDEAGNLYTVQSVDVVFTSTLAAQGKSTISSPVGTVGGKAATTYKAITATGTDTITASIAGSSLTIPLTVTPLDAGSISFVSASPATIGLKGMGGAGIEEASKVTFKVVDTSGAPKANQAVNFVLNTTLGGLSLSAASGSTDADGTVSTIVQSGIVATPVRVTASTIVGGTTLRTQSDQLVVSTGVPAQDGFSISLANMNPESHNTDGVTVAVTARLSDHFHNPVPDGTAVSFTTSGGSIEPSCVTTAGVCSVNWTSQDPRPTVATGASRNGRAVILAYAIGEEFFLDLNGNGVADSTDTWNDTTEAFRDDDKDGFRDGSETFVDFDGDGSYDSGDGQYNGVLQGAEYSTATKTKHVFSNSTIVMATSQANILSNPDIISEPGTFTVTVSDLNGNTMPSGTTIAVTAPFGTLTGDTAHIVPENTNSTGVELTLNIAAAETPAAQIGLITVTVTSPAGLITTKQIPIDGDF